MAILTRWLSRLYEPSTVLTDLAMGAQTLTYAVLLQRAAESQSSRLWVVALSASSLATQQRSAISLDPLTTSTRYGASAYDPRLAARQGDAKITAIKAMQLRARRTLIKIETDAGVSGYGECHGGGLLARKVIAGLEGPRIPQKSAPKNRRRTRLRAAPAPCSVSPTNLRVGYSCPRASASANTAWIVATSCRADVKLNSTATRPPNPCCSSTKSKLSTCSSGAWNG
jgi:hypothetical protein